MTAAATPPMLPLDEAVTQRYWQALESGERASALAVAHEQLAQGRSREQLLIELVCPAQLEVGRRWASNSWSVAREHIATSISEDVVASLAAGALLPEQHGVAVVTCVEGEWHSLPARVLSETLRLSGWQVHYLGASVPSQHLAQFVQDVGPDVVALSCSVSTSLPRARQMIEAARQAGVPVVTGGQGFGVGGRWATLLGADGWAQSASAAVSLLDGPDWPSYTTAAPAYAPPDEADREITGARQRLVGQAMSALAGRFPAMADYDERQTARTVEDIGYILDFLTAALYVDDSSLFVDFVGWLVDILVPRGVPTRAVLLCLDVLGELLPQPRAKAFLASGAAALHHAGV